MEERAVANHLLHWPGFFERRDGMIVEAPPADTEVARAYPQFSDKGPVVTGIRLTLMTRKLQYHAGEKVRVIHVVEAVEAGLRIYVAGPKPVYGEHVDEVLVTPAPPDDVWEPATYNGPVLTSPAVDYNYAITTYPFDQIGKHTIQWHLGALRSNVLTIEIIP